MNNINELEIVTVIVHQSTGKYGAFECPCCNGNVDYKFTASSGWCDVCGATFTKVLHFDTDERETGVNTCLGTNEKEPKHLIELQVQNVPLTLKSE